MTTIAASPEKKSLPVLSPSSRRGERGSTPSTPDQHPYAIKTTSTSVLTRSNSRGFTASRQHLYIPNTPSPASKHRHSKSDASRPSPRPLPIPPGLESPTKERRGHAYTSSDECLFPSVRTRADTLPSGPSPSPASPVKVDELPSNPRVWTTSQLASYLITALRVKSGEALPLPLPVAKDIAAFVKDARLNGRAFLRLNEQDLELMGINNLWREALLNASRNLRQNVLKGRIWGFGADDALESAKTHPYRSIYSSSSSSIDEISGSQESTPHKTGDRKGHVRGLVANLERTSSSGSALSNHGSTTSEGDLIPGAWADDEAAFASGSEASDAEDRKAHTATKKLLLSDTVGLQGNKLQGRIEVASPEEEPSIDDLLTSNTISSSWGAKAWEDVNIGETVKRVSPEHGNEKTNAHDDIFGRSGSSSKSGSGKGSDDGNNDERKQIKDIFARPLPSRPLPSPPKSEASSPLVAVPPVRFAVKVDRGVQVEEESSDLVVIQNRARHADVASAEHSEQLRQTLSLLEHYKQRVSELEEKLSVLEYRGAEQAQVAYQSQAIETDRIPAIVESGPIQVATPKTIENSSPSSRSKSVQVDIGGDISKRSTRSSIMPLHSPAKTADTEPLISPLIEDGPEWRRYFDGREWDPLENGIRSYVLMVGFGVCAVVVSTILKRLAGKKY